MVAASHLNFVIAVLNDDAIDFGSLEVDHVLGLAFRFFRARLFKLKKSEVSENCQNNHS